MVKEQKSEYTIKLAAKLGEVQISNDVVTVIAGLASMEVEGVSSIAGNTTRDLISKLGMKMLSKGATTDILEDVVTVNVSLNLKYGYNIMQVSAKVQEKVKATVENMTGLTVADVNVRIAGVDVDGN